MHLQYSRPQFLNMVRVSDIDDGYDCAGIVVGFHRWYDADPEYKAATHKVKYHQYSELMIGVFGNENVDNH